MPNSMSAERQRAEAKHKQTQATQDPLTRDSPQTHPHKSAKATGKQATADNLRPPPALLDKFTERDGRKGPPARNNARCNSTNTPNSKAS
jgi:hypothetical protein